MTIFINGSFLQREMCGVRRFAENITAALGEIGAEIILLVSSDVEGEQTFRKNVRVVVVGRRSGTLWEQIDLPQYLSARGSPALLSLTNSCPIFYRNNVASLHDVIYLAHPKSFSKWKLPFFRMAAWLFLRRATRVVTVSEFSKREISNHYRIPADRIFVAHNASSFPLPRIKNRQVRPQVQKYILAFDSQCEYKNVDFLLRAFSTLPDDGLSLKLVGGHSRRQGRVEFLGRVSDAELSALYDNAVALVFPSLYEGFGLPTIEAQSLACPVIAARIPALTEILGDSAVFFDPYDQLDFATQLRTLTANGRTREQIIKRGLCNAQRFSWRESALRIRKLMDI